jgi:hypothetical protein
VQTTIDNALQEGRALAGNSSALFVVVLSVVVAQDGLDLQEVIPTDVRWITVLQQHFPFLHLQGPLAAFVRRGVLRHMACSSIGVRARVGGIAKQGTDCRAGGSLPDHVAAVVTPWNQQVALVEVADYAA